MSATKTLADALYREEIARARAMDPGEKLLDDAEAQALLTDRLNRLQALDGP